MKTFSRIIVSVITICMLLSVSTAFAADYDNVVLRFNGTEDYNMAYGVLEIVNSERAANGLSPLSMDRDLLSVAMQRAAEIAIFFDHTRPDGSDCFSAFPARFEYSHIGENIALGQETAAEVMTSWMNSPGHRANILTADYKSIGIGCFYQYGVVHWVQVFSSETAAVPSPVPENRSVTASVAVSSDYCDLYFDIEATEDDDYSQLYIVNVNPFFEDSFVFLNNDIVTYKAHENGIATVTEGGIVSSPSRMGFVAIEAYIGGVSVCRDTLFYSDHDFNTGDVNNDSDINNTDLILVARYIVSIPVSIDTMAADVNYDNSVTNSDLILLARHIVGLYEF